MNSAARTLHVALFAGLLTLATGTRAMAVCGDGTVELDQGETCDDGNTLEGPGDNCPANCAIRSCSSAGTVQQVEVDFAPPVSCVGDCDGKGTVTVEELVRGVNIALGTAGPETCPAMDANKDGKVTVDELVRGVNAALSGCPATEIAGLTVFLRYPEDTVRIPGSGNSQTVQNRIVDLPDNVFFTPNDQDYALTMVVFSPDTSPIAPGRLFTVGFDNCQGAATPSADDFACTVTDASTPEQTVVSGVTCSVALP